MILRILLITYFILLSPIKSLLASSDSINQQAIISKIEITGNAKVEDEAILNELSIRAGESYKKKRKIQNGIKSLYEMGYFSKIEAYEEYIKNNEVIISLTLEEKPAIVKINYEGMNEIKVSDIEESSKTKLFTIVDKAKISSDMRLIEKNMLKKAFI